MYLSQFIEKKTMLPEFCAGRRNGKRQRPLLHQVRHARRCNQIQAIHEFQLYIYNTRIPEYQATDIGIDN